MGRFSLRKTTPASEAVGAEEDPVVRQYRYLLRTGPLDALEAAHAEGLARLSAPERAALLTATQSALSAGARLGPDDYGPIAHLMTLGERRTPGALLGAYPAQALQALAEAVVHSDAVFGLFGGYAAWDGADPQPEDDSAWADGGFNPDSGRWSLTKPSPSGSDHNLHGASPGYGGGP